MFSKKSQLTLFILLGIVILIAMLFLFYLEKPKSNEIEIIQPELMPVKQYIEDCMDKVTQSAIYIVGINGGYIEFPEKIRNNPMSHLPSPIQEVTTPYWWYDGISEIPTEEFIKGQISGYIEKNLKECINNFDDFKGKFSFSEQRSMKATVSLNEEDVTVELDYPLIVSSRLNNTETKISKFKSSVPVRLKKALLLAKDIMDAENRDSFIEKKTIDLMSMDNNIPITGMDVQCGEKKWYLLDIAKRIQEMLRVNLPYVKVVGAEFDNKAYVPTPYGDTYDKSYYNYHYQWRISEKKYTGMHAAFMYDEQWPIKLNARPSDGKVLKSNMEKGFKELSFFCFHIWHFTYDVIFPVKVSIIDEKTAGHDSYLFNFAFKASIDHNYPSRQNFARTAFELIPTETSEEFCSDTSKEIAIYTVDKATNQEVTGVNLSFTCGKFECNMGESDWLGNGAASGIVKPFPYCVYGILRGYKQDYEKSEMFIQTELDGKTYTMYLTPIKEISKFSVVKHPYNDPAYEQNLGKDEKATIIINRGGIESYGAYPNEYNTSLKLYSKEDTAYNLSIYLMDGEQITGGYQGEWKINWMDLENAKSIKFHVLEKQTSDDTERYLFISGLQSYSKMIPAPQLT